MYISVEMLLLGCALWPSLSQGNRFLTAQTGQYCRFRIWIFLTSVEFNVYLASVAECNKPTSLPLFSATSKSCYTQWRKEGKKNCRPSVDADGDLWTVYKLQSPSKQRCPKYVIQIDQSGWWGEHEPVGMCGLTGPPQQLCSARRQSGTHAISSPLPLLLSSPKTELLFPVSLAQTSWD